MQSLCIIMIDNKWELLTTTYCTHNISNIVIEGLMITTSTGLLRLFGQ